MEKGDFIVHACEKVLSITRAESWNDLSEELKVQLGFNMGVLALGLDLSKEDGFLALADLRKGVKSIQEFREHIQSIMTVHQIKSGSEKIAGV